MAYVPTTAGDISTDDLGVVLMHEHVFIRTEPMQWGWPGFGGWDVDVQVVAARERLTALHKLGVDTILDMTVPGLGRDPALVARAVEGTGLRVMFATGFYTYDNLPLPFHLRGPGRILDGDDRLLESLFERDLTVGIADTGLRAAVLKLVTDEPGLTPDVERLAHAVASVQLRTGAPICTHAHAPARRGLDQQRVLAERGVDLGHVMIGHSNESTDLDYLTQIIDNGSYLGWDRCGLPLAVPLDAQIDTLATLCERGYASRVMLSHDKSSFMDWFTAQEVDPALPDWRFSYIHEGVLPGLRDRGVTDDQIEQMLVRNPRDFFAQAAAAGLARLSGHAMEMTAAPRGASPFDDSGVRADADGVRRYPNLHESLLDMLRASVDASPAAEALAEVGGDRVSYAELWDRAARVAGGLREGGIRPGDRVAIRLPNSIDWVLALVGGLMAGAIVVPVNTRFTSEEAGYVIADSGSAHIFEPGAMLPDASLWVHEGARRSDVAAIFYTSGTTGFPKGAMHTHENILANVETVYRVSDIPRDAGPELRTLIVVPLFHVTGCHSQLLPALRAGGAAVIDASFDGARMIETLEQERITSCTAVPAIYYYLLNHPLFAAAKVAGVRWASYGGAPIAPALVHQIGERFAGARLANGFGLTESTSIATLLPHEWAADHADSVGFAAPHTEIAIADAGFGAQAGLGEILIRGQSVCAGYWGKPEATAQTFAGHWLHTGDVGRVGPDGLVYVLDRIKDMINRGGENIYCVEVENALIGAPGVGEVAVVGVPDSMMGEKVGAVIVPLPGATVDPLAVVGYARQHLADYKVPQFISVRPDPLPRNPNGKVLKAPLRATDFGPPVSER